MNTTSVRHMSLPLLYAAVAAVSIAMTSFTSQAADPEETPATASPVLLVCEHGSVKSLIAASLFNQAASARGLPFRAIARGVTPDASVPSKIADALEKEGFEVRQFKPTEVSSADIAHALHIVSIGADLSGVAASDSTSIEQWDDVPAASADYAAAHAALERHVDALLDQLQERAP